MLAIVAGGSRDIPDEELARLSSDLGAQADHSAYRLPK